MSLPAQKFINVIYTWCVARVEAEKREQWEFDLDAPLPWADQDRAPSQEQLEREGQDFLNFMNQVNSAR